MLGLSILPRILRHFGQPAIRLALIFMAVAVIAGSSTLLVHWMGLRIVTVGTSLVVLLFLLWALRRIQREIASVERQKQLLGVTLASIGDGVIVTDAQGRATFLNGEAERLTGWRLAEAEGQPIPSVFKIIDADTRQPVANPVDKVLRLGMVAGLANHAVLIAKDGRETPIDDSGAPIRRTDGTLHGVVLVFRDSSERKQAEETLRRGEQRLSRTQEIAHLGSWELDLPSNRLTWSDEVYRIFGLQPQEFGATYETFLEAVHPDDRASVDAAYSGSLREGRESYEIEHRVVRKHGGEIRIVQEKCEHIRDESGRIVRSIGMVHDITERKRAEEALRQSEERFRLFVEHAPAAVAMFDREMRYLAASRRWLTDYRLNVRDLVGRSHYEVFPEIPERWKEIHRRCLAGAQEKCEEDPFPRADGQMDWVRWEIHPWRRRDGEIGGIIMFTEVITERKRAEDALRFLVQCGTAPGEDFFQELARYLGQSLGMDYVCIDRLQEGLLAAQTLAVYFAGKFEDNVSYTLKDTPCGEVVGRTICCFEKDVRHRFPKDVVLQEMVAESYVGTTLWSSQGQPIGLIAIIGRQPLADPRAATSILQLVAVRAAAELERRQAEEKLAAAKVSAEQARAAAETASKAKDHFLAVLSHELRNPLNPVLATASMLRENPDFDADTREQLEIICRNAELEARLIDDLLDVTRIERGKVELDRRPIELCTIIRRAVEVCMPDIEARKLEFGVDLGPAPCWVDADAARLQQVFWNLLRNAIKFTPVGGCVGVKVRTEVKGARTEQSREAASTQSAALSPQHWVRVEVTDSGIGIEPGMMPRLFDAFEQAEHSSTRQFGGLGLGLTISKAWVEMHGGSISAHSQGKGKGATFTVRLPLLPAPAATAVTPPTPPVPPPTVATRPLRILLVEDHGDTARIMCRLLRAQGHDVETAADVATALTLAGQRAFDLLLSDLGLPDGSGVDLMRQLRSQGHTLAGIAISGFGQQEDIQRSREAGFAAHLTKPVNLRHLKETIAAVAGQQRIAPA